ncbi:unnamed protein product, partial [Owenia fusiformis]
FRLTFADRYARGQREYDQNRFKKAEEEYALALKLASDKKETCICLEALGDVYLEYAKHQNDRVCLLKACALYNGAKVRLNSDDLQVNVLTTKIANIECVMLELLGNLKDGSNDYSEEETQIYKSTLDEIRTNTEKMLNDISETGPYDAKAGISITERITAESEHTKKVICIATTLVERMKSMIQKMVNDCLKNMKPMTFPWAFIGLGSFSRHEMTPYSDIEFAALIGEGSDTPQNKAKLAALCDFFELKVINLGETIVPAMGVKSLNDYSEGGENWFFDSITPRGFSFDADMPKACKFPRGLGGNELIQTPSKMANIQNLNSFGPDGLAEVLTSATFIMGDKTLYDDYIIQLKKSLKIGNTGQKRAIKTIKEDNVKYGTPFLGVRSEGSIFHVKREIFRFPSLMIMNLGMYFGVVSKPPWEIISELESMGVLSRDIAHNLMVLWAIGNQLRLQTYCTIKAQRDNIAVRERFKSTAEAGASMTDDAATFYMDNTDIITRYYKSAIPLETIMRTFTLTNKVKGNCFEDNAMNEGTVNMRLLRYTDAIACFEKVLEETPNDVLALSYLSAVYCSRYENEKACSICESAIELAEKNNVDISFILQLKFQLGRANLWRHGDYEKAHRLFQEILDNIDLYPMDLGVLLLSLAYSYKGMGNLDKSIELNQKAIGVMEGKDSTTLAVAYNNLGNSIAGEKKDSKTGLKYLQKALMMRYRMFGNVPNVVIKENLYLLAHVYLQMGNIQRGKQMAIESYDMHKHLKRINNIKDDMAAEADYLNLIGFAYLKAYENEQAIEYFKEAIEITLASPMQIKDHFKLLSPSYNNLGYSYNNNGDYNAALINYDKALECMTDSPLSAFHLLKARIFYNIGTVHLKQGHYSKAVDYFHQSTELRNEYADINTFEALDLVMSVSALATALALKGDLSEASIQLNRSLKQLENISDEQRSAYLDMGKIYNKIGTVSRILNNSNEAIAYHQLALDAARQIYGNEANHGDIVESFILLAEAQLELKENAETVIHNLTKATEMLNTLQKGQSHPDLEHIDRLKSMLEI